MASVKINSFSLKISGTKEQLAVQWVSSSWIHMCKADCTRCNTTLRSVYSIKFYSCFSLSHQFRTHSSSHIPLSIFKMEWGPGLLGGGGEVSWAGSQGDTFQNPQLSRDPQQSSKSEIYGGIPKALKENFYPGKFFCLFQRSPSVEIFQ